MKKLSHKEIEKVAETTDVFVRWSRGPRYDSKQGRSRDYANGGEHNGLSAVKIGNWGDEYLCRRLGEYRFLRMKDSKIAPYIYTGKIVGKDSDGYDSIEIESCLGVWDEVE